MTSQVINRRERGSASYCGSGRKLCAFTWKAIETGRAAQELLGAPTIGGGMPGQGVVKGIKKVK
jgi:hypothetical protein